MDRPATTTQSGTRHRSCTVCGYEMVRESIPATGGGSSSGGNSSSGGGGSSSGGSSSNTTTSVQNPDGSTTSTNIDKATGTVTETTKRPDGSKTVVETQTDGTVTTSRGVGFAVDLGLELVRILQGEEKSAEIRESIQHP